MENLLEAVRNATTEVVPAPTRDDIRAPTLDDIRKWPAVVDVPRACTAYQLSRSYGYELIKSGQFPAKVIEAGGRKLVVTASIIAALSASA